MAEFAVTSESLFESAIKVAAGTGGLGFAGIFGWRLFTFLFGRSDIAHQQIEKARSELDERWKAYTKTQEVKVEDLKQEVAALNASNVELHREVAKCHEDKAGMAGHLAAVDTWNRSGGERDQLTQLVKALTSRIEAIEGAGK